MKRAASDARSGPETLLAGAAQVEMQLNYDFYVSYPLERLL